MKHLKLFFALFAMLALGVGNAWGANYTGDFVKITSVNELTTGYYVIVASESASANSYAVGSTVNSNKRIEGVSVTIVNDKITNPDNKIVYYITKVGSKYTFQNVNTSKYLYQASTTSGKGMGFDTSSKEITCAGYSTNAPIGFKFTLNGASNNFFKWNNSSKWFANYANDYSTTMAPVRLYKLKGSTETTYTVTVNQPAGGGGTIEADKDKATKDATVTLTATPSTGYKFGAWTVTGASGNVTVTNNQFTMPAEDVTVTASFVAKTQYTISWSVNGATKTLSPANVYEGDALGTPPTPDPSDICTGKVFVGWTTEANKNYNDATVAPELITKDTKPSANTTYYAVFAIGSGTPETWEQTTSVAVGDQVIIAQVDNGTKEMTGLGKTPETADNNYGVGTDFTTNPNGTLIWTVEEGNTSGQFSFNNGTYYLNLGANENYLSYSATKTATSSWTVSTSDERAVVTNANYDSRKIMWNKNNTRFASYSKNHGSNSGQYYYHIVFYKKSGGISYSDYTTSCAAAPEPEDVYNVIIADDIQNGTVTASPTSAAEGATITLTVTPADGYMLKTLAVADESSNPISVTDNEFEMPASNVTVSATFEEIPAAILTLSKNGDTSDEIEGKVGDVINLPTFTSDCSKTFVGWSTEEIEEPLPEKPTSNFYEPGAEYTLAAETQTLYAVYANAVEGAPVNVFSETFDACEGKGGNDTEGWSGTGIAAATLTLDGWTCVNEKAANGCAKFGASSAKGSAETPAIAITGNATLSFRAGAWDNASEVTTLNLSATGANLSQSSITLTKAAWTEYTIYITEATGYVKIKFEASVKDRNRFFLDDVVVSQASVTYSGYSTTCTAALDAPTFTPAAGTYNEVTSVTISATGGDVYYTLDGTTPTKESTKYTDPIVLNTNGTTTIKAIAISGVSQSSVVTATYTIKLPLTTMDEIFAAATTAGSVEAPVLITMNNWVVTGVTTKNAYVTDGTKGFVIYQADHGFNVGDILSGTVACNVQLFKGSAELTELTATTEGLSITTGGTVSTVVVDDVTTLSGINTGSLIKINGVHESDNIVNNVKLYNTLFNFGNLTPGQEYNVTGVYLQYDDTKEILPRSAADIEEVAGLPTATITISNITMVEGENYTIAATVTPAEAEGKVTYSIKSGSEYISLADNVITANDVGTATITAAIAEVDGVYHGTTKDFTVTVNEYVAPISGTWELVTDASTLKAGMEVIVAQYVDADGTIYTMGTQNTNNRASVESAVSGTTLTPTTGTAVLTLVDAGNGTFALQAGNEKYLYAASSSANHLKETATINDNANAKWSVSVTEGKASVVAQGDNTHNIIRFNKSNTPKIFSCYESGRQQDIALYARVPDHIREVPAGYYATVCLPNNLIKVVGATLYEVAGKKDGKLYFDEVPVGETVAGMPYVFFTEAATQEFYYGAETTTTAGNSKSLHGTFVKLENGNFTVGDYMIQYNQIVQFDLTKECWIDPNRAYFNGSELNSLSAPGAQLPGRKRIGMGVSGENETTGTENIIAPAMQGTYDIMGRQLAEPTTSGFYIINGKKVFVVK